MSMPRRGVTPPDPLRLPHENKRPRAVAAQSWGNDIKNNE